MTPCVVLSDQVVEFRKPACFERCVGDVSDARRLDDADPPKAIIADTRKLEGNSSYGSTIMDPAKVQAVMYVHGEGEAMVQANLPQFKKITPLIEAED